MKLSNALVLTPLNGEPRIHDLLLAERLGFERPTDIRKIIKRNEKNLNKFNHIAIVPRSVELGNWAKREVLEYWLNQKQAAFICLKSETDNAFDVQVEVIRVFDAYLTGDLVPAKKQQAELNLHTRRDVQLKNSIDINSVMMERGVVQAIIQYNTKNCVIQSGKHPAELKRKAKEEGLPSRQRQSAKEYLRANNPPVACGMSLADRLVSCGADADAGIAIGKNAQPIFEQIMALGFTPAELEM